MDGEMTTDRDGQTVSNTKLDRLLARLGEFLALFEEAESKLEDRERQLQVQIEHYEQRLQQSLETIQGSLAECERVMTETGVARWRLAAEQAVSQGEAQVQALQSINEEFRVLSHQSCDRLEQASHYAVKSMGDIVTSFRQADFKSVADGCCDRIEKLTNKSITKINELMRWVYWKKIFLVFAFSSLVAVITGLYINDEWPWEDHAEVMHERDLGQAASHAWQQLSAKDKAMIMQHMKHKPQS